MPITGGGASSLDGLDDVIITAAALDDLLVYNGTNWINTKTVNLQDSTFTIFDNASPTKKFRFEASGITAGQTRVLTVNNVNGTLLTSAAVLTVNRIPLTTATNQLTTGALTWDTVDLHIQTSQRTLIFNATSFSGLVVGDTTENTNHSLYLTSNAKFKVSGIWDRLATGQAVKAGITGDWSTTPKGFYVYVSDTDVVGEITDWTDIFHIGSLGGTWELVTSANLTVVAKSLFGGGGTATALVEIADGGGNAPQLLFDTTTLYGTPAAGMMEFDGTDLWFTQDLRKKFVFKEANLTGGRVPFSSASGRLVDDGAFNFSGAGLAVPDLLVGTLTSGRVVFAAASGKLVDDADLTFATDKLTTTKLAISQGDIISGVYTPTLTNVANLDASTAYQAQYMRVGNVVTVSGKVDVDPTLTATTTQLGISLPIASNIGVEQDCCGTAFAKAIAGQGAAILGDAVNDRAQMEWIAGDITNQAMYFSFTYRII